MTPESPHGEAPPDDPAEEGGTGRVEMAEESGAGRVEPAEESGPYPTQAPAAEEFGWEGWLLVSVLILSFLVVPPAIVFLPEARGVLASLGLTMRDAYLALPMVPAILLGITAVWAAVRVRGR